MALPQQPEVNIGLVGHVDHGKTTLTQALTGVWTDRHSEEIKRGISIKLGYADCAFYRCPGEEPPDAFTSDPKSCEAKAELMRVVSFVDAPGHETLMAVMLSGTGLMDGAILMIAANEVCPQPQSKEHLMGLQISGIENIVVVQNKIDLVDEETAISNYEDIKEFLAGTVAADAPIIPISAQQGVNLDVLIQSIEERIPTPDHDLEAPPRMAIARSFDCNMPGRGPEELMGGVIGGSLAQGVWKVGDEVEIAPGVQVQEANQVTWEPIHTTIDSIVAGGEELPEARPGGLLAISTQLDPQMTKSDSLVGKMAGKPGTLPPVWHEFTLDLHLLDFVVGSLEDVQVDPIRSNEPLMLNVSTATTVGMVTSVVGDHADVRLKLPVSAEPGDRVAISRRIGTRFRLIGNGVIR
ncbi:MAG: translation initiation factor IF-2 subunit gamma [Thermoplasmata archaeon]|nr:MAG: translation initiation factor IF-2 subunit gamma [Thermoplasmata archaeon]